MFYLNLVFDFIKFIVKLLVTKIDNLRSPLKISFKKQNLKKSIIIGTGPSLLKDIYEINNYKKDECDFFGVNFFANTKTFFELKPNYYFLADKLFWSEELNKNFDQLRNETIDKLKTVNWKISILCPESGYNYIKSKLLKNSNISFINIPEKSINLSTKKMQLFALQSRFFSIPNVNSVVTLIWYSIICNYSEIYIYGADFSGFKSIDVDQKTNYVSVPIKHFYKNSKAEKDSSNKYRAKKNKSLGERLYQNYRVLKYNDLLNDLAIRRGIDIINRSSFSYIDSFKREK
tara:strand:+ start:501 stop:1367 length:867 start_codon:yes stop_codon:yes gene_type:complete